MFNFSSDLYFCIGQYFAGQIQIVKKKVPDQIQIVKSATFCQIKDTSAGYLCIPTECDIL